MHALKAEQIKVYFGGVYRELWTDDYRMSVAYSERPYVLASLINGRWVPTGGDRKLISLLSSDNCPELTKQYFEAAAKASHTLRECSGRGLPFEKLGEFFRGGASPLIAPELARLLMDDCGFELELAYRIAARCCEDIRSRGVDYGQMLELQPRTAHVLTLLRNAADSIPAVYCDSRDSRCRSPFGAVSCGDTVRLAFRSLGGNITGAVLTVFDDEDEKEYPMSFDGEFFFCDYTAPQSPRAQWYRFRIEAPDRCLWLCPDEGGFIGELCEKERPGFRLTVAERGFETPEWFRRCVMYQIFPDRFAFSDDNTAKKGIAYHIALGQTPELHESLASPVRWQAREFEKDYIPDDFYGGTFRGIEKKLPYLKELGIGCIYLNPIVEARSNHRYDTSDYLRPDPILGTVEDFERLSAAAASMGIRIILDGVFSHTGADSIYFNRYGHYGSLGACQSRDSEYYDWFDFKDYPEDYRSWWGFKELPEVNELDERWQDFVVTGRDSVVKTWLRRGCSGWRLDVADELPDEVLSLIRTSSKAEKPDSVILGEVWEDAVIKESYGKRRDYALGRSLDSVMNYPLRTALLDFVSRRTDAFGLRDFLVSQQMNYPKPLYYSLMNLLGSHDTERLRSALATDTVIRTLPREEQIRFEFSSESLEKALQKEKMCTAVQFSLPGVPSIYYGDEQGMCGVGDPFNRLPFREDCPELHDHYVNLSLLRSSNPALSVGEAEFIAVSSELLLILRYISDGKDVFGKPADNGAFLTVINRSETEEPYEADLIDFGFGIVNGNAESLSGEIIKLIE